jgi:uncharacterized protein (TIGR02996 family)
MAENAALFAAIIANPAEDTPRLAYADWLDENGDPARARFIRLQYEIEKLPPIGAKASKAKKEEEALLKKHGKKWAGEIATLVERYKFRRGFVEYVRVTATNFLKHGKRLFELAPLREVRFDQIGDRMPALVKSPHFGRAEALGFNSHIGDQLHDGNQLDALLGAPSLATVRRLELGLSSLDTDDLKQLARCPYLGAVEHLDLSSNPFDDAALRAVANSKHLPALTSLVLWGGSQVKLDGVRALVDSPLADRLEHLALVWLGRSNDLGDEIARITAGAPRLKCLRTLDLSDNDITEAGAKALAASKNLAGLERFILRGHRKTMSQAARELLKKRFGKDVCVF